MEGRYPRGVLVALTNCKDPAREQEFNEWYDKIHLPDVVGAGFKNPIRFVSVDPQPGQAKYLAVYEVDTDDLKGALKGLFAQTPEWERQGRMSDLLEVVSIGMYQDMGQQFRNAEGKKTNGVLMVITNCKDPAKEDEFNQWYNETHIPDIFALGAYHTAYRYQSIAPDKTPGKFLALYETDLDAAEASDRNRKARADWEARGRMSPLLDARVRFVGARL